MTTPIPSYRRHINYLSPLLQEGLGEVKTYGNFTNLFFYHHLTVPGSARICVGKYRSTGFPARESADRECRVMHVIRGLGSPRSYTIAYLYQHKIS